MKLSIIVVNFKTYEYTRDTIKSVLESNIDFKYEIILIDNASADNSIEKIEKDFADKIGEKLKIVKNNINIGFASANNIGISMSKADYVLLLNSDTKVYENTISNCVKYLLEQNNLGLLTCKVVLEDGNLDHACKRGFPTPSASLYYFLGIDKKNPQKYGKYDYLTLDEDEIGEVDVITGAFMLIPRCIIEKVGSLDEDYFMYGEDIDYCYNVKEAGYKVIYYPKEKITHYKSKSRKKRKYKTIYNFYDSMWIFYKKHYLKKYNFLTNFMVFCGIYVICILKLFINIFKK